MKQFVAATATAFFLAAGSAQAALITFDYSGTVSAATGALATLTPPGTPVAGPFVFDVVSPVIGGLVGPSDIASIDLNVGGFCFSTGPDSTGCPTGGAYVPVTSIDAAAITLGPTAGGSLDFTSFSPAFGILIPISFDFTAGTFFADAGALGTASGNGDLTTAFFDNPIPEPGTLALLGLGLAGLAVARRRRQ